MSIYKGTQLISGVATPLEAGRNIGQIIQSLLPITDAGLHLLDGAVIDGNGIYKSFVEYISKLDLTANYFTTEADWQASVTQYGVCGKFVYDASANTVRLPKVTGILEGTIDANALGDLVEQFVRLPNITGTFFIGKAGQTGNGYGATGAFYYKGNANNAGNTATTGGSTPEFAFNASRSSSVYSGNGTDTKIQPQAIKGYYYIVVATVTKTDIEVDIDNINSDLNNKTNLDLSNITNGAKVLMSGMGMPINKYTNLTLGASGTKYTAPASGWFYIRKTAGATGNWLNMGVNPHYISCTAPSSNAELTVIYPVRKGYDVTVSYQATGATGLFRFIYAEGSRNEV